MKNIKQNTQRSLNFKIQRTLLATWMPIMILLLIVSYVMMQNIRNQFYDTNHYEMQRHVTHFDHNAEVLKNDVKNIVAEYRKRIYVFRNDSGLVRYNIWKLLSEIRQKNVMLDIGYVITEEDMDITYDTKKYRMQEIESIKNALVTEDLSSWNNYIYQLIKIDGRQYFVMQVHIDDLYFGVMIDADAQIDRFHYTEDQLVEIDYFASEAPINNKNLLAVKSEETGYYLVRNILDSNLYRSIPIGRRILLFSALASLILLPI